MRSIPARRRLTISDGLILLAITAVALAAARLSWDITTQAFAGDSRNQERAYPDAIGWFALVESIGLIPLFLRRPRPPLRYLVCQPGLIASIAVAFTLFLSAVTTFSLAIGAWLLSRTKFMGLPHILWRLSNPLLIGPTVATAWLVLVLTSGWRSEPDWLDRLGRFWGIASIALFFVVELLRAFRY